MKKWFAACRYIKPDDLEEFLENSSRDGKHVQMIGQMGLFYYEFTEGEPQKYRYVVDATSLPKGLYMQTMIEKDWEYLGRTMDCYVWRMPYEDKRPQNFADKNSRRKHCIVLGITMLLAMLLCAYAAVALVRGALLERSYNGITGYFIMYMTEAAIQFPFVAYFAWAAKKLLM